MASQNLSIILDLQDRASKQLGKFQGKLNDLKPAFQKMALVGTASFAAVSAGILKTTQSAANAEGSWNKFNTVFGDGAEDMKAFIEDIRKEMPTATHEIVRMSADLQDLLVPMGLARGEAQDMTKGFVDLSNKIAAFNDVDPTEVLEAFKSGLSGSSEPLRRFGINALDSSIEMQALEDGLISAGEKLSDLDPVTRNQVKAQALLTLSYDQSSDAVNGFEANQDSLIRRQQELKALMGDLSVELGGVFLPIIDSIVKKLIPLIERFADWASENQKLVKWITIITLVISGLIAVVGALGLIIGPVAVGFGALATATTGLIALFAIALIPTIMLLIKHWDLLKEGAKQAFENIGFTILAFTDVLKIRFNTLITWIKVFWQRFIQVFTDYIADVKGGLDILVEAFKSSFNWIVEKAIQPVIDSIQKVIDMAKRAASAVSGIGGKAKGFVSGAFDKAKSLVGINDGVINPDGKIISTHPDDYLIATKDPSSLGGGGGGVFNININTMIGEEEYAEKIGNMLIKQTGLNTSI